ncbi:hypothetical protein NKH18_05585 [Streptomyces sp. M10(2022)]
MKSQRELLTPQMLRYDDFDDRAETRYLPYLMYFHRADFHSGTVNTDRLGFRVSHGADEQGSVANPPKGPVRLLAGSSTPFGIGATSDAATVASRLWTRYAPSVPWLNFAGRSHNSMQELLLFLMHRELVPEVDEIVVVSGLNDLALSRLPDAQRGDHGGFFNCGEYFDQMEELRASHRKSKRASAGAPELPGTRAMWCPARGPDRVRRRPDHPPPRRAPPAGRADRRAHHLRTAAVGDLGPGVVLARGEGDLR